MNKFIKVVGAITLVTVLTSLVFGDFITRSIILFSIGLPVVVFLSAFMKSKKKDKQEEKEEKEETKEEETPKESSSTSVSKSGNILSELIGVVIIILLILFTIFIVSIGYEMIAGMFSPGTEISEIQEEEKDEWEYSQIRGFSKKIEYGCFGDMFKVREFKHDPGEELYFKIYWGRSYGDFTSDVGTDKTGIYHNFANGETGRFEVLERDGTGFSGRMICQKNCKSKRYTFTLKKK